MHGARSAAKIFKVPRPLPV